MKFKKFTFLFLLLTCFVCSKSLLAQMPEDYVSIYTVKGEAEKAPIEIGAKASLQLAGPASGWGNMSDWDFSNYTKLVVNLTFDPADAGNQFAVRFNVNADAVNSNVKIVKFNLPTTGTEFSAEIDLEQYAQDGKVGVGGIVLYNGATHWSFSYDSTSSATSMPVTVNYVAVVPKVDLTKMPKDYVSFYSIKSETEKAPLAVGAKASAQLAGPASGWGDLADYDLSKYEKLVVNLTFDSVDAGHMIAFRFNVNAVPGTSNVQLEKFVLPATG